MIVWAYELVHEHMAIIVNDRYACNGLFVTHDFHHFAVHSYNLRHPTVLVRLRIENCISYDASQILRLAGSWLALHECDSLDTCNCISCALAIILCFHALSVVLDRL